MPTPLKNLSIMRILLSALLCLCVLGCSTTRKIRTESIDSVKIREIKPRYIETETFVRISEYLTGVEHTGDRVIIRSQPNQRDGYYFTLILDTNVRKLPQGTTIVGEFYTPFSKEAKTYNFKLPAERGKTKEVFVGLTGSDWPDAEAVPSAWRFTVKDPNGKELDQKESFLWKH